MQGGTYLMDGTCVETVRLENVAAVEEMLCVRARCDGWENRRRLRKCGLG